MKKIVYLFSAFVCTMMFCACASEESSNAGSGSKTVELYATGELSNSLKTHLGNNNAVLWSDGDNISVFTTNSGENVKFELEEITDEGATAKFQAEVQNDPAYALYPYQGNATCTAEGIITFNLPAEQTYQQNSFGNRNNISVGKIDGTNVTFTNTLGLLRFQLNHADDAPDFTISKIVVKDNNGFKLNGKFEVNANSADYAKPTEDNEGTDEITLTTTGVTITKDVKSFYVALPQGALASGLQVTVYGGADGETVLKDFSTQTSNTINRAKIKVMPERAIALEDIFVEVEYLESTGTQYIKTGVNLTTNNRVDCVFAFDYGSGSLSQDDRYNVWGCANNTGSYNPIHLAPSQIGTNNIVHYVNPAITSGIQDIYDYGKDPVGTKISVSYVINTSGASRTVDGKTQNATYNNINALPVNTEIYAFSINKLGSPIYNLRGKIYSMQMWSGGSQVRNFVPGRLKTGGACMRDVVNNKLYFNAAEGADFNVGEDVVVTE